jgi:hypothetical protein
MQEDLTTVGEHTIALSLITRRKAPIDGRTTLARLGNCKCGGHASVDSQAAALVKTTGIVQLTPSLP